MRVTTRERRVAYEREREREREKESEKERKSGREIEMCCIGEKIRSKNITKKNIGEI